MDAIDHANRICDWQENLANDEMPPPWMWAFDEELRAWFEQVEEKRNEKYGGGADANTGNTDAPGMMGNELAAGRGG